MFVQQEVPRPRQVTRRPGNTDCPTNDDISYFKALTFCGPPRRSRLRHSRQVVPDCCRGVDRRREACACNQVISNDFVNICPHACRRTARSGELEVADVHRHDKSFVGMRVASWATVVREEPDLRTCSSLQHLPPNTILRRGRRTTPTLAARQYLYPARRCRLLVSQEANLHVCSHERRVGVCCMVCPGGPRTLPAVTVAYDTLCNVIFKKAAPPLKVVE